ncbi:hypothetical protein CDD81_5060 [Ophiocordyceps australis]|uniref:Uncharacterized protein n=1 Tax=Ophiocordyceps australis TaxID=1399860 RepID=A0A2C5Y5U4_9HYPO|nr:hypothetical protein CDD81_5060 [Ophiocordyceps australis]
MVVPVRKARRLGPTRAASQGTAEKGQGSDADSKRRSQKRDLDEAAADAGDGSGCVVKRATADRVANSEPASQEQQQVLGAGCWVLGACQPAGAQRALGAFLAASWRAVGGTSTAAWPPTNRGASRGTAAACTWWPRWPAASGMRNGTDGREIIRDASRATSTFATAARRAPCPARRGQPM